MNNSNLHAAKSAKNDEFYTRLEDIEAELKHYGDKFRNKIVFCNCDDPVFFKGGRLDQKKSSKFITYFVGFFETLGLKKLICLGYAGDKKASAYIYNGDTNRNGVSDESEWEVRPLEGNGDFRSEESIAFLKEADIVVTNPPFSLFREYVAQLVEYGKKFLIIGNMNAITYKEIFPLIKENKLWLGVSSPKDFIQPDGTIKKFGNILWYTNLDNKNRHRPLLPDLICNKYKGNEKNYPKYDNYDAINIDKVAKIPYDYTGVMGVPITFLGKYNPDEFEIVAFRKGTDGKDLVFTVERERELCRTLGCSLSEVDKYYPIATNLKNGMINNQTINGKKGYCRILIRKNVSNK